MHGSLFHSTALFEIILETLLLCFRTKIGDEEDESPVSPHGMDSSKGLSEACRFIYNDAKFVNERARSDIVLLSRYYSLF